jgi:hypothetical protein
MMRALLAAIFLTGTIGAAFAQSTYTPGIDRRQDNQQRRIMQGVRSGELTPRETYQVMKGQARIQRMENRAEADGRVTRRERRRIHAAQDAQSRRIYNKKHNYRSY